MPFKKEKKKRTKESRTYQIRYTHTHTHTYSVEVYINETMSMSDFERDSLIGVPIRPDLRHCSGHFRRIRGLTVIPLYIYHIRFKYIIYTLLLVAAAYRPTDRKSINFFPPFRFIFHLQQTPNERANVDVLGNVAIDSHVGHVRVGHGLANGVERENGAHEVPEPTRRPGRATPVATGASAARVAQSTRCIQEGRVQERVITPSIPNLFLFFLNERRKAHDYSSFFHLCFVRAKDLLAIILVIPVIIVFYNRSMRKKIRFNKAIDSKFLVSYFKLLFLSKRKTYTIYRTPFVRSHSSRFISLLFDDRSMLLAILPTTVFYNPITVILFSSSG